MLLFDPQMWAARHRLALGIFASIVGGIAAGAAPARERPRRGGRIAGPDRTGPARALPWPVVFQPEVLIMDGPFAAVDAQTRADLEDLAIDLPPECSQLTTRALRRFTELRTHIYDQIQRAKRGQAAATQSAR